MFGIFVKLKKHAVRIWESENVQGSLTSSSMVGPLALDVGHVFP